MDARMDGRVALITGGSRGIGRAMALKFAESGADVAILARRAELLEETRAEVEPLSGRKAGAYVCDMNDPAQIEAAFGAAVSEFGRVDVLVNNAGTSFTKPFEELTDEEWLGDLNLKLMGAIRTCRLALPGMKQRRWGRIINVLNLGAKAPSAGRAPTHVSRAAGMALTKILAGEGAPYNILANALITGRIVTDQTVSRYEREKPGVSFDEFVEELGKDIPLGRMGTAEEYANVACFLASDAGSYVTGTAINIDGNLAPVV